MNKRELKAVMVRNGDTGTSLAEYLGMARSTFSQKINENGSVFTQKEMAAIKRRYSLSADDMDLIFFEDKVS